ncbi:MAG: hypothetical protein Q9170_004470 [Blastenia crenularia]
MSGWDTTDSWSGGAATAAPASTSWDAGTTTAPAWDDGAAIANNASFSGNGFGNGGDEAPTADGEGGGDDRACRICNQVGHLARECPDKPEGFGKCFNCGEEGRVMQHATARTSRLLCAATAKKKVMFPQLNSSIESANQWQGHITSECTKNKVFDYDKVDDLPVEEAWANVLTTAKEAVQSRDLDDFRDAIKVYHKACKDVSYEEIERAFRTNEIGIYLIATEPRDGEVLDTHTLVNLSGKRDCKYKMGYFFKKTPRTEKMAEGWPSSEEENLERLKDAGIPYERGIPKCLRCKEMGHTSKDCKEEPVAREESVLKCFNCDEEGHRTRECKKARVDRFACRNCKPQDNLVITQQNARNRVQQKGLSARDARKWDILRRIVLIIPVAVEHVATAEKKGIWLKSARSRKTRPIQRAATATKLATLVRTVQNLATGVRLSAIPVGRRCPQANAGGETGTGGFATNDTGDVNGGTNGFNAGADAWGDVGAGNTDAGAAADSGWANAGTAADTSSTWGAAPATTTVAAW